MLVVMTGRLVFLRCALLPSPPLPSPLSRSSTGDRSCESPPLRVFRIYTSTKIPHRHINSMSTGVSIRGNGQGSELQGEVIGCPQEVSGTLSGDLFALMFSTQSCSTSKSQGFWASFLCVALMYIVFVLRAHQNHIWSLP